MFTYVLVPSLHMFVFFLLLHFYTYIVNIRQIICIFIVSPFDHLETSICKLDLCNPRSDLGDPSSTIISPETSTISIISIQNISYFPHLSIFIHYHKLVITTIILRYWSFQPLAYPYHLIIVIIIAFTIDHPYLPIQSISYHIISNFYHLLSYLITQS